MINASEAVEVGGVGFQTLVSQPTFSVPASNQNVDIPVGFGIRITNNTSKPLRFNFYSKLTPELVEEDGQVIRRAFLRRKHLKPQESHFPIVMPGEVVTYFPNAKLHWRGNCLVLSIAKGCGGRFNFDVFSWHKYQFRFTDKNENSVQTLSSFALKEFWIGTVYTPFAEFTVST